MIKLILAICFLALGLGGLSWSQPKFEKDVFPTEAVQDITRGGPRIVDLEITFLGHGSLMMTYGGMTIHVDPYGEVADYSTLSQADLILVTHDHFDHLDPKALKAIVKPGTTVVASKSCAGKLSGAIILANGESRTVLGLPIEAVAAYNILRKRPDGNPFHPKGPGNGYVITFGNKRVYIAGDTEETPEMKALKHVDIAFLPMNLPYTMSVDEVARAARDLRPKVLYPYHTGDTPTATLVALLKGEKDIEVRIRKMS
ncbi:MAG TPA: MBL fold metallo-hydrolase [Acidobacteriota bacterium]|nr:MBL fold metallo-hydrolase [Acidobacteriota bacterium]